MLFSNSLFSQICENGIYINNHKKNNIKYHFEIDSNKYFLRSYYSLEDSTDDIDCDVYSFGEIKFQNDSIIYCKYVNNTEIILEKINEYMLKINYIDTKLEKQIKIKNNDTLFLLLTNYKNDKKIDDFFIQWDFNPQHSFLAESLKGTKEKKEIIFNNGRKAFIYKKRKNK